MSRKAYPFALFALLVAIALFHGIRVNGDHGWADDGSQYLIHAQNMLAGRPYGALGFTQTPASGLPGQYPPALPALLALTLAVTGLDFLKLELLMLVLFVVCVAIFPVTLHSRLGRWTALAVTAAVGFNPELSARLIFHINSEGLWLFFILCFLIVFGEAVPLQPGSGYLKPSLSWAIVAGTLSGLAIATRATAVALLVTCLVYCYFVVKRERRFAWIVAATGAAWILILRVLVGSSTSSYLQAYQTFLSFRSVRRNLIQYPQAMSQLLGTNPTAMFVAAAVGIAGAVVVWRRRQFGLWESFCFVYALIIIPWPFSDPVRYGLPFLLLWISYIGVGFETVAGTFRRSRTIIWLVVSVLVGVSYAREYRVVAAERTGGIFSPPAQELWSFVRDRIPADSLVVFNKSRTLTLLTNRRSSNYPPLLPSSQLWPEICAVRPTHVIAAPSLFPSDQLVLQPALDASHAKMRLIFRNSVFLLYEILPEGCADAGPLPRLVLPASRWDRGYPLPNY